ncbi:hypothetical protein BpHYR1_027119 [Brachionus plicatilis]|uniref:Uncharacterized protein n=1 Tax=Brachionus plicatilis TaxID=10195 RepID=A0A3M7SZN5_BRAPC|nr:hypothetical protein BpHYR1_027119 [Brachionus plicatilis]
MHSTQKIVLKKNIKHKNTLKLASKFSKASKTVKKLSLTKKSNCVEKIDCAEIIFPYLCLAFTIRFKEEIQIIDSKFNKLKIDFING